MPVPPLGSELLAKFARPVGYLFGVVRALLVLALTALYLVLVPGICTIFVGLLRILEGLSSLTH
jgi:hypothetical protein